MSAVLQRQNSTSQYTDIDRQRVIAEYAVIGNLSRVAEALNMPVTTVHGWVSSEWGQELLVTIRKETQDEFIAGYTNIVRANLSAQADRLQHGDIVGLDSEGEEIRQGVRYRDLVVGGGIAVDKIRLLSNQATSITATDGALTRIAEQLASYAKDRDERVIDTQTDTQVE